MLVVTLLSTHAKIVLSAGSALAMVMADAVTPSAPGWEDLTMKALLCVAIGWLVSELSTARKEAKAERETHAAEAKVREDIMQASMRAQAEAMAANTKAITEQTDYFKAVVRGLIERGLQSGPNAKLP